MQFWKPPVPSIPLDQWEPFWEGTLATTALICLVFLILFVALYAWLIRRFKIRRPTDPFRLPSKLWWMGWVVATAVPAALVGFLYWSRFTELFTVVAAPWAGSIAVGFATWGVLLALFETVITIPGVTPSKFRNHPWLLQVMRQSMFKARGGR